MCLFVFRLIDIMLVNTYLRKHLVHYEELDSDEFEIFVCLFVCLFILTLRNIYTICLFVCVRFFDIMLGNTYLEKH